jgi:copper(I)-binding protein
LLAVLALTGCAAAGASSSIGVASAYVPVPTTPGTTVAYLVIRNNGGADRLVAVHTSVGGKVQLRAPVGQHEGVLTMRTVSDIPIPANAMTRLNPDSYHLLITGAGPMQDGKDIMLQLTFADAGTVTVIAMVTNPETGGGSYFLN